MSDSTRRWLPQDVLWELGGTFIDATAATAAAAIESAMERVARLLRSPGAGVWRIDPHTMEAVALHRWAVSAAADLGEGAVVKPDATIAAVLDASGGLAVLDLEFVIGAAVCARHGWSGASALVAVIDQSTIETTVLVIASGRSDWTDSELELIRGTVLLLRQFTGRIRIERRLQRRDRLSDLTVSLAGRFPFVSAATLDGEVEAALVQLSELLSAESVVLIDVVDDQTVALPHVIGGAGLPPEWRVICLPDISEVPGAGNLTLREFVREPRFINVADLVDAIMGPEMTESLDLRAPPRNVTLFPASVVDGDALLAITRLGDNDWTPEEFDSLSTLASLVAQTRGRVDAERSSQRRLEAQRALAATGKLFLEASAKDADEAIHTALEETASHLGADLSVIASLGSDHETLTIVDSWARPGTFSAEPGTTLNRNEVPAIDKLLVRDAETRVHDAEDLAPSMNEGIDDKWTTVTAPIRGAGLAESAVTVVWTTEQQGDLTPAHDLVSAIADLIGQLNVRLRAEDAVNSRLEIEKVMSELADDFLGASCDTADTVISVSLRRFGTALGLQSVGITRIESDQAVLEAVWAAPGQQYPDPGFTVAFDPSSLIEDLADYEADPNDPRWGDLIETHLGGSLRVVAHPVLVAGRTEAMLNIAGAQAFADHEVEAFRAFAALLGQFRSRVAEERLGRHRLAAQRLLSGCAAELAEATAENSSEVIERVLADAGDFCGVQAITDWQVDRLHHRYVRGASWMHADFRSWPRVDGIAWGDQPLLDQARTTAEVTVFDVETPTLAEPPRLAIPRGDGAAVDHVLLAASKRSGAWTDEVIDFLGSLSRMIREVQVRVAAQRYAEAAFQGAPIGVVLRDEMMNLITCNQAFVDFVGAASVDELIGTGPEFVYDEEFAPEFEQRGDLEMSAEAAFKGPGGSRVWGQMRGAMVAGDSGEGFWLIHIEDVTERRRAEQLLRFQASHDELTGLANRRRLLDEVHRLADGANSAAVLLLDLDRFKNVNDSLGHDRGDELLVVVADRLRLAVRPGDLVARLGGDEFAVVLPGPVAVSEAEYVAERLLALIGEPVTVGHQKIYPTASIGIAVADDHTAVDDLIRRSDTAMYRAKAQGRARYESFDEELREAVTARMATESGLRGALRGNELLVHYQPEVSLVDGSVLGAEALVRWEHPEKGLLAAGEFIEVAEETGLVVEIGELVLAEACREAASWSGGDNGPMIRVNLAAAQLQRKDTVGLVESVLAATKLHPNRLCLEITESAVMSDVDRSEEILHRLRSLSIHLAVDDFGTGFSSLAYLKRFPVDALKIDRAFINDLGQDVEDEAFVRSIVSLADALGLDVVAEGVETTVQAEKLLELGCRRAQGYLFGRPAPAEELRELLRQSIA